MNQHGLASSGDPPEQTTVAAFDFDGTLTHGGSVFSFLVFLFGRPRVVITTLRTAPALLRAAILGGRSADHAKELMFMRLFGGVDENRVIEAGSTFAKAHLEKRIRPEVRARLDWHLARGHRVVLVSASPAYYVTPAAHLLGAEIGLATRLQVAGGKLLTGRYDGSNCRGPEKYAQLVRWMKATGVISTGSKQPVIWAYGNSRGDLRLLEAADFGIDAGRLGKLGRLRRFKALQDL